MANGLWTAFRYNGRSPQKVSMVPGSPTGGITAAEAKELVDFIKNPVGSPNRFCMLTNKIFVSGGFPTAPVLEDGSPRGFFQASPEASAYVVKVMTTHGYDIVAIVRASAGGGGGGIVLLLAAAAAFLLLRKKH